MASKIEKVRTAPREVRGANTRQPYVVELVPAGLYIRRKGQRGGYGPVSYDAIFGLAVKLDVAGRGIHVPQARRVR